MRVTAGARPTVAIIVPHWGDPAGLVETLRALRGLADGAECVAVVCNDRRAGAAVDRAVHETAPPSGSAWVVIHAERNAGYAGAVNRGIAWLDRQGQRFDLYWILNNDAQPEPQSLDALRRAAAARPGATAMISCRVVDRDGSPPDCGEYSPWRGRYRTTPAGPARQGLNGVSGASIVLTAGFLRAIERLPEHLFLYFEEPWLAYAAARHRMDVIACARAVVRHRPNTSMDRIPRGTEVLREYLDTRARVVLAIEWHPICLLSLVPLTIVRALASIARGRPRAGGAIIRALVDGLSLRLPVLSELDNVPVTRTASLRAIRGARDAPAGPRPRVKTWTRHADFDPDWRRRSAYMARHLPPSGAVVDIGCGEMGLEQCLSIAHTYVPVDLEARDERTTVVDLDRELCPAALRGDVAVVAGVLEYLHVPRNLVASIERCGARRAVVSYCTLECQPDDGIRRHLSWVTHLTEQAVVDLFAPAFRCTGLDRGFAGHVIFVFERDAD